MMNIGRLALPIASILIGIAATSASVRAGPVITTAAGQIEGMTVDGLRVARGIPFARPPVGALRWRPPENPERWSGIRPADKSGPACPQPVRADTAAGGVVGARSEDCLTLNVWAPAEGDKRPVMVWIHGGAYRLGAGSFPFYDGASLARQGVVVVTINYRLGPLGFFAHPSLTRDAKPDEPLGNYGLMDQLQALRWVQQNITSFGGDPANVTVFGESAGGGSIIHLLANPAAKGLFTKAIVQSGGGLTAPQRLAVREAQGETLAIAAGANPGASAAELRALSVDAIETAASAVKGLAAGPFIDGRFVTEAPWRAFAAGRALDVPLIIGANSNEASVATALGFPAAASKLYFGPELAEAERIYGLSSDDAEFHRQAFGDAWFVAPARWIATNAASGAPAYLYHFNRIPAARRGKVPGTSHGGEIPYVFANWSAIPALTGAFDAGDREFAAMASACWVAFARTGVPSCPGMPAWPPYTGADDALMLFDARAAPVKGFRKGQIDLLIDQFMKSTVP